MRKACGLKAARFSVARLKRTYLFVFPLAAFAAFAAWLAALAAELAALAIAFAVEFEIVVFDVIVFDVFVVIVFDVLKLLVFVLRFILVLVLLADSPQAIPSALTARRAERAITFFMI